MAYLAFDIDAAAVAPSPRLAGASFTPDEWTVIGMARRDPVASLRRPSRLGTALRRLFGLEVANRLADPRLEALRCAAVRCWRSGRSLGRAEIDALLGLGFRFDQIALLARHASR